MHVDDGSLAYHSKLNQNQHIDSYCVNIKNDNESSKVDEWFHSTRFIIKYTHLNVF